MDNNYTLDLLLKKLDTKIKTLEVNPNVTQEEIDTTVKLYNNIMKNGNYTKEQTQELEDRLRAFSPDLALSQDEDTYQELSTVSPKNYKFNKNQLRAAIVGGALAIAIASVGGCALRNSAKNKENIVVETEEIPTVEEPIEIEYTEMSKETLEYCDKIVLGVNNSISRGFKVTEENKESMAKKFINYSNVINMDELTANDWATYYQNGNVTAQDIMNDYWDIETVFEKIITVSESKEETINFDLFYKNQDAKLLLDAEEKIIKINTSKGDERKTAIKEMHDFIIDTLTITENRMQYSEVCLNTFRGVFVNAFDVLSNGNSITDEEEHAIFTVFANCNNIDTTDIKVEDKTIKSMQSKLEIYMTDKLDYMLSKETEEKVNPFDSIDEMSKYVASKIDITLYKEARDYVAYQEELFIKNTPKTVTVKNKNDSGVSDGKGGTISKSQFEKYGIDPASPTAKTELENSVKAEFEKEAEANKVHTDISGQVVDPATRDSWVQEGANDCNKNIYNPDRAPELYRESYKLGWESANQVKQSLNISNSSTTSYVDTTDKVVESSTTVSEQTYTGSSETSVSQSYSGSETQVTESYSNSQTVVEEKPYIEETIEEIPYVEQVETFTEFESVTESSSSIEEVEEINYTSSIKNLKDLRSQLLDLSNVYTEEVSKIKC